MPKMGPKMENQQLIGQFSYEILKIGVYDLVWAKSWWPKPKRPIRPKIGPLPACEILVLDPQNLTFSVILHKKCLHTGHFIIVKFSQEFKKVDLVKLWCLIKSPKSFCCSTADPKSLNFTSKCLFTDCNRPVSGRMGFFIQIKYFANKNFSFRPVLANNGRYRPIRGRFCRF